MARPIDHQKRIEIARQAFDVVLRQGVQGTTMSDIAKALGMKRPTLYWYFPDVGSLFDAVAGDVEDRVLAHVVQAMAQKDHPIDQLIALLDAAVSFYESEPKVLHGLIQLWAVRSQSADSLVERQRRVLEPQRRFLVQLVQQGVESGRIRACSVEGLVDTILTVVDGTVFRRVTLDTDVDRVLPFIQEHVLLPLKDSS
jgi:TetR/AcrR family transcriptional regulator